MRYLVCPLIILMLTCAACASESDVETGWQLVEEYCSVCHATGAVGLSPHHGAPPFRSLHDRFDVDALEEGLVEGLVSGHPDMPEFEFDPIQAQAIISYLKSLE